MIKSVLSWRVNKFACFDIKTFYLGTPIYWSEYVIIKPAEIPKEVIDEYNLNNHACNGWVYFNILKDMYGLPQTGKLANGFLTSHLNDDAYDHIPNTPGIWWHKWWPVMFSLVVNNFGTKYVKKNMRATSSPRWNIPTRSPPTGMKKICGIDISWDFYNHMCRLTMKEYIDKVLLKFRHTKPTKRQLSPHKHHPFT